MAQWLMNLTSIHENVLIGPLCWEHPYAMGVALRKTKKKKGRKKNTDHNFIRLSLGKEHNHISAR